MNIIAKKTGVIDIIEIQGRIDGLTAAELKLAIGRCTDAGVRLLVFDCSAVTYISSAGLRVFIQTHKSLGLIGGKMILMSVPGAVKEVFRISGMDNFMSFIESLSEVESSENTVETITFTDEPELEGITFEIRVGQGRKGRIRPLGSSALLEHAAYTSGDVVTLPQHEIPYSAGLAVLGNEFEDYQNLFGEAVVINHRFFSYPAVKRPFVDFSGFIPENPTRLNFLTGFGFTGDFSRVLKIAPQVGPLSLDKLLGAAGKVAEENLFGVVILAVSGGISGMHLRKSPVKSNNPAQSDIFDDVHFAEWMNFPVDSEDIHKVFMAAGLVVRDPLLLPAHLKPLFPVNSRQHLHAVVFENGLLSQDITEFEPELQRVMAEFEAQKVVHLLSSTLLQSG